MIPWKILLDLLTLYRNYYSLKLPSDSRASLLWMLSSLLNGILGVVLQYRATDEHPCLKINRIAVCLSMNQYGSVLMCLLRPLGA